MILVDTGPLVAIVHADDIHHTACSEWFSANREPLGTVWPVVAEVTFLLGRIHGGRSAFCQMIERGGLRLLPLDEGDVPRMRELMEKYADLPMDLADAALVRVAERDGLRTVFTVDRRDFSIYRLQGRGRFRIVP